MNLTDAEVREILQLLDRTPYDELDLQTDRYRLILRRNSDGPGGWTRETQSLAEPRGIAAGADQSTPAVDTDSAASADVDTREHETGTVAILSPMIGTFYRAPKPGAAPFVEVGSRVEKDTVIAIIEVMKLMNSVPAGRPGVITGIHARDGEFIEAGQALMRMRPDPV